MATILAPTNAAFLSLLEALGVTAQQALAPEFQPQLQKVGGGSRGPGCQPRLVLLPCAHHRVRCGAPGTAYLRLCPPPMRCPLNTHIFSALPPRSPLAQILAYHVVPDAAVTAAELTDGETLDTLNTGESVTVGRGGVPRPCTARCC